MRFNLCPRLQQQTCRNPLNHTLHAHSTLTREAVMGCCLGCGSCFSSEQAALFEDQLFARSQRSSTSGLSAGNLFKGTRCGIL